MDWIDQQLIIYYLSLWMDIMLSWILEDNENTSVLYPTINGVEQRLMQILTLISDV